MRGRGLRGAGLHGGTGAAAQEEGGLLSISLPRCLLGEAAHFPQHLLLQTS